MEDISMAIQAVAAAQALWGRRGGRSAKRRRFKKLLGKFRSYPFRSVRVK